MEFTSLIDNPYNRIVLMSVMGIATALLLVNAIVTTRNTKKNPELVNRMVLFTPAPLSLGRRILLSGGFFLQPSSLPAFWQRAWYSIRDQFWTTLAPAITQMSQAGC